MNEIIGILNNIRENNQILELEFLCNGEKVYAFMLESKEKFSPLLGQKLPLIFKETHILLGQNLRGPRNCFVGKVKSIQADEFFLKVVLFSLNQEITALVHKGFNAKVGDTLFWCVLESEIMLSGV